MDTKTLLLFISVVVTLNSFGQNENNNARAKVNNSGLLSSLNSGSTWTADNDNGTFTNPLF